MVLSNYYKIQDAGLCVKKIVLHFLLWLRNSLAVESGILPGTIIMDGEGYQFFKK